MHTAIYLRVSTSEQDISLQLREITSYLKDGNIFAIYCDAGLSGTTTKRPELQRLLSDIRSGHVKHVVAWKMDRLFRSLKDLINTLQEWNSLGVTYAFVKDSIDMNTPAGRLMMHLLGAFAEFEAALVQERVRAGMQNAKARGTRSGKPIGRPIRELTESQMGELVQLRKQDVSYARISQKMGIPVGTLHRKLK